MTQQYYPSDELPEFNEEYYNASAGGMINNNNGIADKLLQNNDLYRQLKGDWSMSMVQPDKNFEWKIGKQDGKLFVQRTQHNVEAIKQRCKEYREWAEAGFEDVLGPITDDGKFAYRWMDLPKVTAQQISDDYFGGMHWEIIKRDRTTKAQFYQIVEQEYPEFICYPGGRLPLPIRPRIPTKKGGLKTLYGGAQ